MKPIIGISCALYRGSGPEAGDQYSRLNRNYSRSVRAAGGFPLLLPCDIGDQYPDDDLAAEADSLVGRLDGLLLSGGPDVAPDRYGQDPIAAVRFFSSIYDRSELALFAAARRRRLPVFGICRGSQLVNVALGGTLIQDIPSASATAFGHYPEGMPMAEPYHRVRILEPASIMAEVFGTASLRTNSFHHQAVDRLADGLKVTARSNDGIIEAYEGTDPGWYISCVQFHPEAQTLRETQFLGLFRHFVSAAGCAHGVANSAAT